MLKPYEIETQVYREILVEPHLITCNINKIIKDKVWNIMKSVCTNDYGFVLRLKSIDTVGKGYIDDTDTGMVKYPVTFTVVSFKPNVNDVIIACVTNVSKSGFFSQLGPLEIFVPHTHIPESYIYKFSDGNDIDNNIFESEQTKICKGEYVRIRVCAIQKMDIEEIFDSLSIQKETQKDTIYIGGVLEAIGELIDE